MGLDLRFMNCAIFHPFGEYATYFPSGGSSPRQIKVNVNREPREKIFGERISEGDWVVSVQNDDQLGITGRQLNLGQDKLEIEIHPRSGQWSKRTLLSLLSENTGTLQLQAR